MFCDKLKELRKEKDLTQEELAKKVFISRSLIAKYETGASYPSKENLEKLAVFFDVEVNDLIDTNETTLEVINNKSISEKINFVCLLITAIISGFISIFVFIPVFKYAKYIYPIEPGEIMPKREYYWDSIFTRTYNDGNYLGLILFFVAIITCTIAILAIVFKHKKYCPFLRLASYLMLFCTVVLLFTSMII